MDKEIETEGESIVLEDGFLEISGMRDTSTVSTQDDSKKFKFSIDPYTLKGQGGVPLGTFSKIWVTAYRGQIPSALYIVPDFDYTTYGWNFPYSNWELYLQTREGVTLEVIRLNFTNADSPCPARTVHFNHTYQASSDYLGVLELVALRYNPPNPTIYKCWGS